MKNQLVDLPFQGKPVRAAHNLFQLDIYRFKAGLADILD